MFTKYIFIYSAFAKAEHPCIIHTRNSLFIDLTYSRKVKIRSFLLGNTTTSYLHHRLFLKM
ncbi:hypothetical protein [Nonlabens sp.]|uniref:hypothetical protein n=1 Tax=Nonlabens sp. TaxID=1888209 RepID=UPI003F69FFA1